MNIFVLDKDPELSAQMLCDRHVSKMILETAQMLTAVADRYKHPTLYKVTHKNHPCTLWAGDSYANWKWLCENGLAMEREKILRTDKGHISAEVIRWYLSNNYGPPKSSSLITPFALAMPEQYRGSDPVKSYRDYYLGEKQFFKDGKRPKWTKTLPPTWWEYS